MTIFFRLADAPSHRILPQEILFGGPVPVVKIAVSRYFTDEQFAAAFGIEFRGSVT